MKKLLTPTPNDLCVPVLTAMYNIGIPSSKKEIYERLIIDNEYDDEVFSEYYKRDGKPVKVLLEFNFDWTLTYLIKIKIIKRIDRGIYAISDEFDNLEIEDLIKKYNSISKNNEENKIKMQNDILTEIKENMEDEKESIKIELLQKIKTMNEYDFEKFSAQMLLKLGFINVSVTQKSGDKGINGIGEYVISKVLIDKFAFQCKRYSTENVTGPQMKEFVAALSNKRIKQGIYITTTGYSADAKEVANTSGDIKIQLIDGNKLSQILFDLKFGIKEAFALDNNLLDQYKYNS